MRKSFALDFSTDDKVVGGLYVSVLKDLLEKEGVDLKGYSGETKLLASPKTRLSPKELYKVMRESLRDAPLDIGFRYGMSLNLVAAETVGQLLMSCADLNQAIEAIKRFHVLLSVSIDFDLDLTKHPATIQFAPIYSPELQDYLQYFLSEVLFTVVMNQAKWLSGKDLKYTKLFIPYAKPKHAHLYEQFFDCDIEYDSSFHGFSFEPGYLELPVLTANEQLKQIKLERCSAALKQWEGRFSVVNRVRAILAQSYPDFPDLPDVATQLNTSRSCLYRKLQENDTSYQCLINEFKQQKSIKLLEQTSLTIPEIAEQLGFCDASSFRRAFKGWTGLQPSRVREASLEQSSVK